MIDGSQSIFPTGFTPRCGSEVGLSWNSEDQGDYMAEQSHWIMAEKADFGKMSRRIFSPFETISGISTTRRTSDLSLEQLLRSV